MTTGQRCRSWRIRGLWPRRCTHPASHDPEPPHQIDGIDSRTHQCDCGSWWADSIRRDASKGEPK